MTLRDYLALGRRWWWLLVLGAILGGAAAWAVTGRITPVYAARATLVVNQVQDQSDPYRNILANQSLTKTYAELATSDINIERAHKRLNDPELTTRYIEKRVSGSAAEGTQLIFLTAEDRSPARAAQIANALAATFPDFIRELQAGQTTPNTVAIGEAAKPNNDPVRPNKSLNVALGMLAGLFMVTVAVGLVEYLDDGIDERDDIAKFDAPFLGHVLQVAPPKGTKRERWVPSLMANPQTPLAEAFRQIQANMAFSLSAHPAKVILVTSASPGEGKSTTAANLAEATAESSKKVLLIDGDLRKPDAHRYFSLPNASGLTSAFLAGTPVSPAFFGHIGYSLAVLTSGPVPPNPSELLSSPRLARMIEAMRDQFDLVIIDSPPILGLADATLWLSMVDGVILVARKGRTRRGAFTNAIQAIRSSSVPLIGVVLNGASRRNATIYDYSYGYAYRHPEGHRRRWFGLRAGRGADGKARIQS